MSQPSRNSRALDALVASFGYSAECPAPGPAKIPTRQPWIVDEWDEYDQMEAEAAAERAMSASPNGNGNSVAACCGAVTSAASAPILTTAELESQQTRRTDGQLGTSASGSARGGSRHRREPLSGLSAARAGQRASKSSVEALADVNRHIEIATLILNGMTTPKAISRHLDNIGHSLSPKQIERVCRSEGFLEIYNKMLERKFERLNDDMADESANPYKRMHATEVRAMTLLVESLEEVRARVKGGTNVKMVNPDTGEPLQIPPRPPTSSELNTAAALATRVLKMGPNANRYQRVDESQVAAFVPTAEQARVLIEADTDLGTADSPESADMVDLMRQSVGTGVVGGMVAARQLQHGAQEQADAAAALDAAVEQHRAGQGPVTIDVEAQRGGLR